MDAGVWGPSAWRTIHYVALGYPTAGPSARERAAYKRFFTDLGRVLPCVQCSENYEKNIAKLPIDRHLEGRDSLFEWTVLLHNEVNRELGKREWTVAEARRVHEPAVVDTTHPGWWLSLALLAVGLVLLPFGLRMVGGGLAVPRDPLAGGHAVPRDPLALVGRAFRAVRRDPLAQVGRAFNGRRG